SIPFEALITDPSKGQYLIQSADISYAYSMSFLYHNDNILRSPSEELIAFSPIDFKTEGLASLKETETEVKEISNLYGGIVYSGQEASKSQFLAVSDNYGLIHLATHAQAGKNPWIAFSDGKMGANELYTFDNQAELVVLSACNTFAGKLVAGEGFISLARGFFYSGANAIVASLWNVNDQSASLIIQNFYANLQMGLGKSDALRGAKLRFLEENSLSAASPYYWASFTLMGNTAPLPASENKYGLLLLALSALFFVVVVLIVFFRKTIKV
ncbi:MAG: CHAT domain-containing protein, partial [Bacteroidota bacterium]